MNGRIDALAERFPLPAGSRIRLSRLTELLAHDEHAPTAIRDPDRVALDHIADAIVAVDLPQMTDARDIVDIGSGAGIPGLPLAIALPHTRVVLLESNARKCAFLESAIATVGVPNARVVCERAEAWRSGFGTADVVTVRAVAALDVAAEYAAPLLRIGGTLIVWRGRRDLEAEAMGERAAADLGLEAAPPVAVEPYECAEHRYLHLMLKVSETPPRFPRRVGVARKRPLGARKHSPST